MKRLQVWVLGLIFLPLVGCATFESISMTGKLAQQLEDHRVIYEPTITICDYLSVFAGTVLQDDYCQKYSNQIQRLGEGIKVLIAYGKSMEKIATDSKFSIDEKIALAIEGSEGAGWLNLEDDTENGIKKIAASVVKLVTNSIKRSKLKEVVRELNDPVQKLASEIILPELLNRKELYNKLLRQLNDLSDLDPKMKPGMRPIFHIDGTVSDSMMTGYNQLDEITIIHVKSMLETDLRQMSDYEKTVKAFTAAHQKLFEQTKFIGSKDDLKVTKEIVDLLKNIYKGVDKIN